MPRPEDLDCLFGTLINMGAKEQETGPNYMKFLSGGNSYVLEWIGGNLLLWKANMLFREGCRLYSFDKKTMDGLEVGEKIWSDLIDGDFVRIAKECGIQDQDIEPDGDSVGHGDLEVNQGNRA